MHFQLNLYKDAYIILLHALCGDQLIYLLIGKMDQRKFHGSYYGIMSFCDSDKNFFYHYFFLYFFSIYFHLINYFFYSSMLFFNSLRFLHFNGLEFSSLIV